MDNCSRRGPAELDSHRVEIGGWIVTFLRQFWVDDEYNEKAVGIDLRVWIDALQFASLDEIRGAWTNYLITGPRTSDGRLRKPDAGIICRYILSKRPDNIVAGHFAGRNASGGTAK